MDLANDAEVTQNDFDALINFDDAGNEFFTDESGQPGVAAEDKGYDFSVENMNGMGFDADPKSIDFANLTELHGEHGSGDLSAEAHSRASLTADLDTDLGIGMDE
ncbi:Cutinase transcription factor [Penicillium sp. IBT 35674x]|nr:Cutinase transcription factor [Penicillium sp. IBT 35674x]